jgi:CHAT domain-containing protein/Flp pilus assembly protein TadD
VAAVVLLGVAMPASAEYFTYEGEMQFQPGSDAVCSKISAGTYRVVVHGHNEGPLRGGIEAVLFGDEVIHAYIRGLDPSQMSLTFIGENRPSHSMRLRPVGIGAYVGELQGNSLLGALVGCDIVNAQIRIARTFGANDLAAYQAAVNQFQFDMRAWQIAIEGLLHGKAKEAIPVLKQALADKGQAYGPIHPQLLAYYYYLARIHFEEGSIPASIPLYRNAVAVCDKYYGPESACASAMLWNLGMALADGGMFAEAESASRRALAISDRVFGPASPMRGAALNGLSLALISTGRYGEADAALREAVVLNKRWSNPVNGYVAISMNNYGFLYELTGQYKKAEDALRKALAIDEKIFGRDSAPTIANSMGLATVLRVSGQYAAAEPFARRAVTTAEKILGPERQDHPILAKAITCLADVLRETGRFEEAESLYRRALANSKKYLGPDHPSVANIELLLAKLLHATARDPEALALLSHANVIAHISGSQMIAWQVAGELMEIYSSGPLANQFKAIFYGKMAVNDLQKLRGNLSGSSPEAQKAFVASADVSSIYRTLASLLIADGRPSEAPQVLAMVKEQEFYEFTQHTQAADAPNTVATLNSTEKQLDELNGKYVALGKEYGALKEKFQKEGDALSAADRARLDVLRKAMDSAQANFEARATDVAKSANDPEAQKRRKTEINDYSRAFQGTLKDMGHDAVVIQYIVLNDKVAILLASPNVVVARESKIKRQNLYALIRDFRRALTNPNQDPKPQGQGLYQVLVAPIAEDLRQAGAKTLMLDLDDMLRYVPFAALYDGKHYLVENSSLVMVTEAVRDKLAKAPKSDWSVWGLGITKAGPGYLALPYAGVELNGIAGQKGILAGKVMLDTAFTEKSLRDGLDQSYPIIHIASHFQFTPGSMDDSFLLLGDGNHLTLAQIRTKLNFNSVELLTLSACETAVGDDSTSHHGVEVEGLGAIAQQAGAKAVLATLWPVADASTAELMRALYQAHKADRLDKADALRQAQLTLLRGSARVDEASNVARGLTRIGAPQAAGGFKADPGAPYAHPFYWAPFILMGNWL